MITFTQLQELDSHAQCPDCHFLIFIEVNNLRKHALSHGHREWQYLRHPEPCTHKCSCGMPCERYQAHEQRNVASHQCHFCYTLAIAQVDYAHKFQPLEEAV